MIAWSDLSLLFAGHWLFAVAALPLLWVVLAVYRHTRPTCPTGWRRVLQGLRWLSLALLLALVAEPVVAALTRQVVRPSLTLLLDTSRSMAMEEGGQTRLEAATSLLAEKALAEMLGHWEVRACGFAEAPYPLDADTATAARTAGRATDLAAALEGCRKERRPGGLGQDAILLVSDGAHNLGADPVAAAADLRLPVHALVVGSRADPADLQVVAVEVPSAAYAGRSLPLAVTVRSRGFGDRRIEVAVYDGDQRLAGRTVELAGDGTDQRVEVELPAADAGPRVLRVQLPVLEGERATDNNQALAFCRVRAGRLPVLLVASAPGPDLAFVGRALIADSSLAVEQRAGGPGPVELDGAALARARVVVLVDPGVELLGGPTGRDLADFVRGGGGLLLIAGPKSLRNWPAGSAVGAILPLALAGGQLVPTDQPLQPRPAGRDHPILRYPRAGDAAGSPGSAAMWEALPPVAALPAAARARDGAQVLLTAASGQPVLATGTAGRGRTVVAAAAGFWRLDLMSSGAGEDPRAVRHLWQSAVKWLALEVSQGRVRAAAERPVYRAGAPVAIVAEVYDELMRPQPLAQVEAVLDGDSAPLPLESVGGGRYRGTWRGLDPGEHHFAVRVAAAGAAIGADEGDFVVEEYSVESMDVRARPDLLAQVALASGGTARRLAAWRELAPLLDVAPRLVEEERRWSLWGHGWVLAVAVGLLSAEWVVRKRHGML